ncbi:uncharacterized protein Triagg1_8202 [Trichoderma aggressivum f. europaeum]|uniref:DNA2/NAM7 helicase helicase domain-containing protein n=1 Tax=Trichoderma aggressivum f. europaeum TaxID=173218 RepID=A0AAE1IAH6_9HYPO|nr:hypothetical protein Triagg1_8202 [Trichoderma aggressivum f. europaeum]
MQSERSMEFFAGLMNPANTHSVQIKRMCSDKTIRAEVNAISSLKHPTSTGPRPSEALGNVIKSDNAPRFLRDILKQINPSMREAFGNLSSLPVGISFLPEVAGSGKSYMEIAIIFSQFGSCKESVQPADAKPDEVKILYFLNNNAGVETFTNRLVETYNQLGIENSPPVIRLDPMGSEVKSGMKGTTRRTYEEAFGQSEAEKDNENASIKNQFLATHALNEILLGIHNAYDNTRKATRFIVMSYASKELVGHLGKVESGEGLDDDSKSMFKAEFKSLYEDFLIDFHETVVTTPVGASNFAFRQSFRPDIVILDEAGTMRELTTLIPIAFLSPKAWIVTGDIAQKPPYISMKHDLGAGKISSTFPSNVKQRTF